MHKILAAARFAIDHRPDFGPVAVAVIIALIALDIIGVMGGAGTTTAQPPKKIERIRIDKPTGSTPNCFEMPDGTQICRQQA